MDVEPASCPPSAVNDTVRGAGASGGDGEAPPTFSLRPPWVRITPSALSFPDGVTARHIAAAKSYHPGGVGMTSVTEQADEADSTEDSSASPTTEDARAAAALLADLRRDDDRLLLPERDVRRLAPAVATWLERGAAPDAVRRTLSADLPPDLRHPSGLLAHRLSALLPPPLPAASPASPARAKPRPAPLQNCDGCDRAFRAPEPGVCRDCREPEEALTQTAA